MVSSRSATEPERQCKDKSVSLKTRVSLCRVSLSILFRRSLGVGEYMAAVLEVLPNGRVGSTTGVGSTQGFPSTTVLK